MESIGLEISEPTIRTVACMYNLICLYFVKILAMGPYKLGPVNGYMRTLLETNALVFLCTPKSLAILLKVQSIFVNLIQNFGNGLIETFNFKRRYIINNVKTVSGTVIQAIVKSFLHSCKIINISKKARRECQLDPLRCLSQSFWENSNQVCISKFI
jgi:hypothetical protein